MRVNSWITLGLFVLAFGYFSLTFTGTLELRDEGYLLARSLQVAEGAVPHRDFTDVYGPGVFALAGAALSLGDGQILAVRILVALFKALAIALGFAISRRLAPRWVAVFAAAIGLAYWGRFSANLNAPYAALFTIPIALAATLALIRSREGRSLRALVLAGAFAGLGVLFKQSLGLMLAYGLLLSAIAVHVFESPPDTAARGQGTRSRRLRVLFVAGWLLAGAATLAPVAGYLTPVDYLIHFFPMHAIFIGVVVMAWPPRALDAVRLLRETVGPFLGGLAIAPVVMLLFYAAVGGFGPLLHDMFSLPFSLQRYYVPVSPPPLALAGLAGGAVTAVVAALFALGSRPRWAGWVAAAGVALLILGLLAPSELPRLREPAVLLGRGPFALEGVLAPVLLLAALVSSWCRHAAGSAAAVRIPVLVVWSMLCFQVFPRAGHNLWILHGALTPLLAMVIGDLLEVTGVASASRSRWRKIVAAVLVAIVPIWLVIPIVRTVVAPPEVASEVRSLALPRARGLALDSRQIEELRIRDLEEMLAWLATYQPGDAPLLVLTNEELIPFLSGRRQALDDYRYVLFLVGWGMWPGSGLDTQAILASVRQETELLVILRADATAERFRRALPQLHDYIETNFRPVARFGSYRVLGRLPGVAGPSRAAGASPAAGAFRAAGAVPELPAGRR